MTTASRYHDISAGHRVAGHENKCASLHGHNYRFHFHCTAPELDKVGRVIDFSVIKSKLCMWLEEEWDHKFIIWREDAKVFNALANTLLLDDLVIVPFNPTAENMAKYLVEVIGPQQLKGTGVTLKKVVIEETRKCSASYDLSS